MSNTGATGSIKPQCCLPCDGMPSTSVKLPCCPDLQTCCEKQNLDFHYRVRVPYTNPTGAITTYEVTYHYQLQRCFRSYAPGDIVYTTTLFPGEKVKLFTSDRHSNFTIDSETKIATREASFSNDSQYLYDVASSISNVNLNDLQTSSTSSSQNASNWNAGGSAGLDLGFFSIGGGGGGSGSSSSANSLSSVLHQLNQHSETSSKRAQIKVHSSSSISIGEVHSRSHTSGESDDVYESSSRTFSNTNKCRSVSYFFYRINKCYVVRYKLIDVHFRVLVDGGFNSLTPKPIIPRTGLSIKPAPILATSLNSVNVVNTANLASDLYMRRQNIIGASGSEEPTSSFKQEKPVVFSITNPYVDKTFAVSVIQAGLGFAKSDALEKIKISDQRVVSSTVLINADIWCHDLNIPTPGVTVKSCLDDCNVCENASFVDASYQHEKDMNLQKLAIEKGKVALINKINSLLSTAKISDISTETSTALSTLADIVTKFDDEEKYPCRCNGAPVP